MSKKSTITGIVIGAIAATAVAAVAGYRAMNSTSYAEVVSVKPIMETITTPREECRDEVVTRQKPVRDSKQVTGTVAGAVIGGVLGSQIGSGSGRDIATVAGAAAGGYAGNKAQERIQQNNTYDTVEQRCETVYDSREQDTGLYEVRYRLEDGTESTISLDHDPGERLPLGEDGRPQAAGSA